MHLKCFSAPQKGLRPPYESRINLRTWPKNSAMPEDIRGTVLESIQFERNRQPFGHHDSLLWTLREKLPNGIPLGLILFPNLVYSSNQLVKTATRRAGEAHINQGQNWRSYNQLTSIMLWIMDPVPFCDIKNGEKSNTELMWGAMTAFFRWFPRTIFFGQHHMENLPFHRRNLLFEQAWCQATLISQTGHLSPTLFWFPQLLEIIFF